MARAKTKNPLQIVAFAFLSTHFHLLLWTPDAKTLSRFMGHFNSKMGKEIKRLTGWGEKIWGRRYRAILISDEPLVQEDRLEYVLSHSVKEGLVERVLDWPGAHSVHALLNGEPMAGVWYDRTGACRARRRKNPPKPEEFAQEEILMLDPLPCWRHLSPEQCRARAAEVVARIEETARVEREKTGNQVLGVAAIQTQHPHTQPNRRKKSPAPLFHAWSKRAYRELYEAYGHFVAAFGLRPRSGGQAIGWPPSPKGASRQGCHSSRRFPSWPQSADAPVFLALPSWAGRERTSQPGGRGVPICGFRRSRPPIPT